MTANTSLLFNCAVYDTNLLNAESCDYWVSVRSLLLVIIWRLFDTGI